MAEVAGLVVGGIGALALVDTALNGFERIESGASYGREYNKTALKLSLNELRLSRWKEASAAGITVSEAEAAKVKKLLGEIGANFEDAERIAARYEQEQVADLDREMGAQMENVITQVHQLAKLRQKTSSLGRVVKWALHDERKFKGLAEDQTKLIAQLVDLFPATSEQQMQLVKRDAQDLIAQSNGAGPSFLLEAADEVDPELSFGLKAVATDATHTFRNVRTLDEARAHNGDFVDNDFRGSKLDVKYNYEDIVASHKARQHNGTKYGGGDYVLSG